MLFTVFFKIHASFEMEQHWDMTFKINSVDKKKISASFYIKIS